MIIDAKHIFKKRRQIHALVSMNLYDLCLVRVQLAQNTYKGDLFTKEDLPVIDKLIQNEENCY